MKGGPTGGEGRRVEEERRGERVGKGKGRREGGKGRGEERGGCGPRRGRGKVLFYLGPWGLAMGFKKNLNPTRPIDRSTSLKVWPDSDLRPYFFRSGGPTY